MRQILFQIGGEKKLLRRLFQMLQQAYGEDCLSRTQCHEWYQRFKSGRTSVEDDPKSGRSNHNSKKSSLTFNRLSHKGSFTPTKSRHQVPIVMR